MKIRLPNEQRRLRTFGMFDLAHLRGLKINSGPMASIYRRLRDQLGFRESWWQFVYHGQLGGVVLPYNDGRNELHARFYDDHIFVEYEIGRAYLTHFIGPRFNANEYLRKALVPYLDSDEKEYLEQMLAPDAQFVDEREMAAWTVSEEDGEFEAARSKERTLLSALTLGLGLQSAFFGLGWRVLVAMVALVIPALWILNVIPFGSLVGGCFAAVAVVRLLPGRGQP